MYCVGREVSSIHKNSLAVEATLLAGGVGGVSSVAKGAVVAVVVGWLVSLVLEVLLASRAVKKCAVHV